MLIEFKQKCRVAVDNAGFDARPFKPGDVVKLLDPVAETCIRGGLGEQYVRGRAGRPTDLEVEAYEAAGNGEILFNVNDDPKDNKPDGKGKDDKPKENTEDKPPETKSGSDGKFPQHTGGGWYLLSDGQKVHGGVKANEMQEALNQADGK